MVICNLAYAFYISIFTLNRYKEIVIIYRICDYKHKK